MFLDETAGARLRRLKPTRPLGLPEVARGALGLDGCVDMEVVHEGGLVQVVHWACVHDGAALRAERAHTHWVISLLHTGACTIRQGRGDVMLDPATAVVHQPGAVYRTRHPFGCCDEGWSLAFDRDAAEQLLDREGVDPRRWNRPSRICSTAPIRPLLPHLALLHRLRLNQEVDALSFDEAALEVLAYLVAPPDGSPGPQLRLDQIRLAERACSYLNENYRNTVRLADVAAAVRCSPYHLCRIFKRHRGISIGKYVQRLRLQAVLTELGTGHRAITDIALEQGFGSHSHMTTVFTAELGVPPSTVRETLHDPECRGKTEVRRRLGVSPPER